jgi:hypothetical protein
MIAEQPIWPQTNGPVIYQTKCALNCTSNCSIDARIISWVYNLSDNWKISIDTVRKSVSETHWMIFLSYLTDGQSSRQLAEQFGTTEVNVRVITHRIRRKLKEAHGGLTKVD